MDVLEKAKEAINFALEEDALEGYGMHPETVKRLIEAHGMIVAALEAEKPSDDSIKRYCYDSDGLWEHPNGSVIMFSDAVRYAESYHERRIKETEKPEQDAMSVSGIVIRIGLNEGMGDVSKKTGIKEAQEKVSRFIQSFAESYHAKKCAECDKLKRSKCALCGDPIIIGVCENCVPEMFSGDNKPACVKS